MMMMLLTLGAAAAIAALVFALGAALVLGSGSPPSPQTAAPLQHALAATRLYYRALHYFWWRGGRYSDCDFIPDQQARIHLFALVSLTLQLWSLPHYRNRDFQEDLRKNLRNVAFPGTGVPLSWLCVHRFVALAFLLFGYPIICLAAAYRTRKTLSDDDDHNGTTTTHPVAALSPTTPTTPTPAAALSVASSASHPSDASVAALYADNLLTPTNWFALWQLNCRLTSFVSTCTQSPDFALENKWTFLEQGDAKGVRVSPFLKIDAIVVKDKNEEGGMGIHMFKSASAGGDFIIQKKFANSAFVNSMLPSNAPLSTLRVITACGPEPGDQPTALSCVFRAGRAGAATDHSSVLFDVDMASGTIKDGTTNAHWYQLGTSALTAPKSFESFSAHPDTGRTVTGLRFPNMAETVRVCTDAHRKLIAGCPIAGWDVALTEDGQMLLEVNLSCNFFQATFDHAAYFALVDRTFRAMERRVAAAAGGGASSSSPASSAPSASAARRRSTVHKASPSLATRDSDSAIETSEASDSD